MTDRSGKWLCFVAGEDAERMWYRVAAAVRAGRLGSEARMRSPREGYSGRVIEVRTYDWTDEGDVMRVREELRRVGFEAPLPYKADEDSASGMYGETGFQRISKHYV